VSLSLDIRLLLLVSLIVTVGGAASSGFSLITLIGIICLVLAAGAVIVHRGHVID